MRMKSSLAAGTCRRHRKSRKSLALEKLACNEAGNLKLPMQRHASSCLSRASFDLVLRLLKTSKT